MKTLFMLLSAAIAMAGSLLGKSAMTFSSSPKSYVGQGKTMYFSENSGVDFGAHKYDEEGLHLWVVHENVRWSIVVRAAKGDKLVPGYYLEAVRTSNTNPLLCFSGDGRCPNQTLGSFCIREIEWGPNDTVKKVALDFIQYDEAQDYAKTVGSFRYHSDVPIVTIIAKTESAPATLIFNRNLSVGMRGVDVEILQAYLVAKGFLQFSKDNAKGFYGSKTKAAVAAYQNARGISPVSGYFGPVTRACLNADCVTKAFPRQ